MHGFILLLLLFSEQLFKNINYLLTFKLKILFFSLAKNILIVFQKNVLKTITYFYMSNFTLILNNY